MKLDLLDRPQKQKKRIVGDDVRVRIADQIIVVQAGKVIAADPTAEALDCLLATSC